MKNIHPPFNNSGDPILRTPFSVVIPAAGISSRFGGKRNKLFEPLAGRLILQRALDPFLARPDVGEIMLACSDEQAVREALTGAEATPLDPRIGFCPGGASRAHSVRNAVRGLKKPVEHVAVHDAARPLLSQQLIDRTLAVAIAHGAAAPALAVHLTIKDADGPLPAKVRRTLPRHTLWALQTPQIVRRPALLEAFDCCPIPLDQVTDDLQLIELAGGEVWLVDGEERNIKITTALDLAAAERVVESE